MYHPDKTERISATFWVVDGCEVAFLSRFGWAGTCRHEQFRMGGKAQKPCMHARWVILREEKIAEINSELSGRIVNGEIE